jgi:single stranded DNA-binding protein (ssb)
MADDVNRITLLGNLTKDAVLKEFDTFSVLNFTLASNRTVFKNEQKIDKTVFVDCKYFSKGAAKLAQYLTKGKKIAVDGTLEQESWEKDGQKFSKLVINVSTLEQLTWDKDAAPKGESASVDNFPEDCPF